jgi:predicted secreted protein
LEKIKLEATENRTQRLALIDEVKAWGEANAQNSDWRAHLRALHQFGDRWRNAGHLSEKAFAELQPLWKQALHEAAAPLEAAQKVSNERRQALIAEAEQLGAAPVLRVDAVKALQQTWQAEAQSVPMDRRIEQKMWEAFRKPIDEAFSRKTNSREQQTSAPLSAHDRLVLDASNALKAANASGDVQKIKAAMAALDAALKGQAKAEEQAKDVPSDAPSDAPFDAPSDATAEEANGMVPAVEAVEPVEAPAVVQAPKPARPLMAMRGDDRPGQKKSVPAPAGRGGPGDRRDGKPGVRFDKGGFGDKAGGRFDRGDRTEYQDRGPRLGDAAFRAQRDAKEHAEMALRKLAAQAHGESLTNLLAAWEKRQADLVPSAQDLGRNVNTAARTAWAQAVTQAPKASAGEAILRLEMAAEVPTPAEHLNERRALQLQLLTRKNQAGPAETWGLDVTAVLSSSHDAQVARRLQNALKNLLRS